MKQFGIAVTIVAWIAFIACLVMPVTRSHIGWDVGLMAVSAIPHFYGNLNALSDAFMGLGNIAMLLLPLAIYANKKFFYAFLTMFFFIETGIATTYYERGLLPGYYFWVASFLFAAAGMAILTIKPNGSSERGTSQP